MILCSFIQPTTTLIEAAFNTTPLNIYGPFFFTFLSSHTPVLSFSFSFSFRFLLV